MIRSIYVSRVSIVPVSERRHGRAEDHLEDRRHLVRVRARARARARASVRVKVEW